MEDKKLFIPILLGTIRKEAKSIKVANYLLEKVSGNDQLETKLIDIGELNLPMDDEGPMLSQKNPGFAEDMKKADGLIIVAPEYNHSYPGSLKRALDILYDEYNRKAVGICGVSMGGFGGTRVIESLLHPLKALGLVTMRKDLNILNVTDLFDESGKIKDESYDKRIQGFLNDLIWMAKALRWGRENLAA